MIRAAFRIAWLVTALATAAAVPAAPADPAAWVNPFVGTDGHGHTFPGATRPFGLVQASPDTRVHGWDACGGYHYSDNFIYGVSHTHLSGVGIQDYCDILVAPQTGEPSIATPRPEQNFRGYGSRFSHAHETAEPGYYAVRLEDVRVGVELTTTARVALHRYTFPAGAPRSLVIDLEHRDTVLNAELRVVSPTEIAGYRRSTAWAKDQRIAFVIRFERPVSSVCFYADSEPVAAGVTTLNGTKLKALVTLAPADDPVVQFKVALSPVDPDGARRNLEAELPGWDFAAARTAARAEWNRVLGRIAVEGRDPAQLRTFYTALYHTYICPNVFSDADGSYVGRDGAVRRADHGYYTVFSLWDTYRAWHPLMTILEPEATRDFIRTFLLHYQQGGLLPVWDLAGNETFCMNGYHAVSVIADAWAKGIRGFDADLALAAMKHSATRDHFGLGAYRRDGYIAREEGREGVARTLEYAYDDWCIGTFAAALGRPADRDEYLRRSQNYRHLFSPRERFFVARENGGWYAPFNPREINFNYTEGNAWHYRFAVPHDLGGLSDLLGGDRAFGAELDALFADVARTEGRHQADVTGLIGQYAHGNEPSHHVAYLYNYVGRAPDTQRLVRRIMTTLYSDRPDGLCGNEDCGQMSAWYVFSALGFYPVTPGQPLYAIGSPLFGRASIDVGGGKKFTVVAQNQSAENVHIASATLNGAPFSRSFLTHEQILAGGELVLTMSATPNPAWGTAPADRPVARVPDQGVVPAPIVQVPLAFRAEATVAMQPFAPGDELWFTLDGTAPEPGRAQRYTAPFTITEAVHLACVAVRDGRRSPIVRAESHRADTGLQAVVRNPIDLQYTAGGPGALVDGVRGGPDFTTGRWQGYEDCDLDVVVDLGRVSRVRGVSAGFLQSGGSYVAYPAEVSFEISDDGETWRPLATVRPPPTPLDQIETTSTRLAARAEGQGRYVRLLARNPGRLLAWGAATERIKSYLFCDEIEIDRD